MPSSTNGADSVELVCNLGELRVTISGPSLSATALLQQVLVWVAICLEQALPQLLISLLIWCLLRASLEPVRQIPPRQETRAEIEATFVGCPRRFLQNAAKLTGSSQTARRGLKGVESRPVGPGCGCWPCAFSKQDAPAGFAAKILRSGPGHRHFSPDPLPVRWDLVGDRWRSHYIQQRHTRLPIGAGVRTYFAGAGIEEFQSRP